MRKINIGYFGDGAWAIEAFKLINNDDRFQIQFVCSRFNSEYNVLVEFIKKYNIDILKYKNVNSPDFLQLVDKYKCDIFVSMSFDQIFKKNFIEYPPLKTINCHSGKLPFYRGRNVLNWVLINDEKEFGITVHYVDEGIDTGDIILQRTYPITDNDDYSTLLDKAYKECANILYTSLVKIYTGEVSIIKQNSIHPVGFYCTERKDEDETINWDTNSREIFNFVRALCKPGIVARTKMNGNIIKINKVKMIENAPNYKLIPGIVVGKDNEGFIVKSKNSTIKVIDYEYDGKVKIGDRFE